MNHIRIFAIWLVFVLPQASFAGASQVLKAIPNKVDLGTFNAFQIIETTVKLSNTGKNAFQIDKIKAKCSCLKAMIDTSMIHPGKMADVKITLKEPAGGKFSYDLLVIPVDTDRYKPLKIQFTGNVIKPVFAKLDWKGKTLTTFDPNETTKLGLVHKLSVRPVIYITADDKHFDLRHAVPEVNSKVFKLTEYKLEKLPFSIDKITKEQLKERLILSLRPKTALKPGVIRELLRINLTKAVAIEVPISCQVVGDAYGLERIIHMGSLSSSTTKKFTIYFVHNTNVWSDLRWDIRGYLSDAISISKEDIERTGSNICVKLNVDRSKLPSLPQGYVFCRIKFYQEGNTDEAVELLVDGFNSKPED